MARTPTKLFNCRTREDFIDYLAAYMFKSQVTAFMAIYFSIMEETI